MASQQQSIIASHHIWKPTIPTNRHLLPQNQSPSSNHPFATNHPHPTSTTQKRCPICRGSHPSHGHRFLNQNLSYPPCPPYPQTHKHLIPHNRGRSPSSGHQFATIHPHVTSTTQKRRPIFNGSHLAHSPSTMSGSDTLNPARQNRTKGFN